MIQTEMLKEMDKNSEITVITGQCFRLMGLLMLRYFCSPRTRRKNIKFLLNSQCS